MQVVLSWTRALWLWAIASTVIVLSALAHSKDASGPPNAAQQACIDQLAAANKNKKRLADLAGSGLKLLSRFGGSKAASQAENAVGAASDAATIANDLGLNEEDVQGCLDANSGSLPQVAAQTPSTIPVKASPGADQTTFQLAAVKVGEVDALFERCQGARPGYRSRYDTLVAAAHPGYRDAALSLYDATYQTMSQTAQSARGECGDAHKRQLEQTADMYFAMLQAQGVTASPTAKATGYPGAAVPTSGQGTAGAPAVPAAQNASAAAATTAAAPAGQAGTYARRSAFTRDAQFLAAYDAGVEKCQGTREDYRSRFDSLVVVAHPDYRAEAMSLYDQSYSLRTPPHMPPIDPSLQGCSDLQSAKAVANRMLDQLGANCAAASQCASKPTETPVPGTANASVANASTPKSAAFESASARAQALSEACERMQEENGGVSIASFGGGRRNAALPPSEVDRKQKSFQIVRTCISECAGAQSRLDNARPDQPIEAFNTYVVACESSYADAAAL